MIPVYRLERGARLTPEQIKEILAWKRRMNADIDKADRYYQGRPKSADDTVPVPFGRKLIKSVLGFMFKEGCISYRWPDEWGSYRDTVRDIFDQNDEQTENVKIARDQARYGSAYEILYIDNDEAQVQFAHIPARQMVPIYSYDAKSVMWAAVNLYRKGRDSFAVDVYYDDCIERWKAEGRGLQLETTYSHMFGSVPVVEYRNNDEGMGDIESIEYLIDAHNRILANGLAEDGKYADALLLLTGMSMDEEKLRTMSKWRLLELDDESKAEYLTKPVLHDQREVLRKVIEKLIYSMSGIPNLDDRDSMAQQSGEALKYLYATFEIMVAGDKQSGFTDGLVRRLGLINAFLSWLGQESYPSMKADVLWKRNLPNEGVALIDEAGKVEGMISRRSLLDILARAGAIKDTDTELKRLQEEGAVTLTLPEDSAEIIRKAYGEDES